jgi:UDP-N-acetylglucosamine--N-acetylmuramyl-(pentapeptide) pyrophosphoryl-undecaprenol N-acetylglucosamine transferase
METTLVPRTGIPCYFIPMAPPFTPRGALVTLPAIARALVLLRRTRPRVIFATGGYVSTAASVAGWMLGIPVVLFLPDIYPGKAVRALAPLAQRIAVTAPEAGRSFPADKVVVTGYPLRPSFVTPSGSRARRRFGIPLDATLLLVFGGSLGARHLNQALARVLPSLLRRHHVIHVAGEQRLAEARAATQGLSDEQALRYHLVPYLHDGEMADALAAANLALCRSGASVLAELPAVGTPAVLVPLPEPRVHQRENAEFLASHGAGVVLDDEALDTELGTLLESILGDPARLTEMAIASHALAHPDATARLAALIEECAA